MKDTDTRQMERLCLDGMSGVSARGRSIFGMDVDCDADVRAIWTESMKRSEFAYGEFVRCEC